MQLFKKSRIVLFVFASFTGLYFWTCNHDTPDVGEEEPTGIDTLDFCITGQHDQLCATIPHDVITGELLTDYNRLKPIQGYFDNFSWQTFIGLNWPANENGPLDTMIGKYPTAPRVWEYYKGIADVFGPKPTPCNTDSSHANLPVFQFNTKSLNFDGNFLEATSLAPLIDKNLNFVLYDIRMNPTEVNFIDTAGINTQNGIHKYLAANNDTIIFPSGFYDPRFSTDGGDVGAIEIKSSWRILVKGKDKFDEYHCIQGHVSIPAEYTVKKEKLCFVATMGLVGMHIIHKTRGPYSGGISNTPFPELWIWSTFEHKNNAPLAENARNPEDISFNHNYDCVPSASSGNNYSFFNSECVDCPTNKKPELQPTDANYLWGDQEPYAKRYAKDGKYGTQVVRCWDIYSETKKINARWQEKLKGTVWENYMCVGSQWQGEKSHVENSNGNIPRYLSNTTMETYIQNIGSCISCHKSIANNYNTSASLVLGHAQ